MITRIAVLGSTDFIERLKQLEEELPTIRLDYYIYNSPIEAIDIVPNITPCDAVFFSGSLPYLYTKERREQLPVPTHYLKQDGTAIATTLLSTCYSNFIPIQEISIDLIEPQLVHGLLQDVGQSEQHPYMMIIDPTFNLQEVVAFHSKLQENGQSSLAITSIHAVYQELRVNNISVIPMIDPKSSIIKGIEETKSMALLAKSQSAKIAVGYIQLMNDSTISDEVLKKISSSIHASVVKSEDYFYTLFSTQGAVQKALENNTINTWLNLVSSPLKVAFGFGKTVTEATKNAKDALPYVAENTAYLITDNKELLGPYPNNQKQVQLKTNDPVLAQLAKETTLSPANLSKIMQFSRSHKSTEFTAYDLEIYLQVSRRTTERILKKLVNHGYAHIIGEEMTYQQGRPRAVYEINFPTYV
ncbi:transcriptional regulator [Psychrobacillus vulpis]|uniref:Transcriptional regulator n=1 Tax=Psychrobacillus vulpis TaxID=2325572 RepID=A0A544TSN6_9BACI|nr:transcriptional regulator [Psychrobacillus vulpis]TQR20458.1 transcriptional regulator [Psychrobacillus vulpis]